ncbi:MAG: LytTR family DNA-binding domain-containing protein [Bdellovibrionia bacterium]
MIRVLLVDDEAPARERLKRLLGAFSGIEIAGEAENGLAALEKIDELKPDVVFLDIEMPELNGLETAEALAGRGPAVVFVTAYDEHALRAFETNSIDYLVKPVAAKRLGQCIEKLKKWLQPLSNESLSSLARPERIALGSGAKYHVVNTSDIVAVVTRDGYSAVLAGGREILSDDSLDRFIERLGSKDFLRVHRNAIINLNFVQQLHREGDRKYDAVMADPTKTKISISRERLPEILARFDAN